MKLNFTKRTTNLRDPSSDSLHNHNSPVGRHIMKNKDIEDIIIEYCEGFEHLEFNYSDLPEMVEKIIEIINAKTDK